MLCVEGTQLLVLSHISFREGPPKMSQSGMAHAVLAHQIYLVTSTCPEFGVMQ